MKLQEVSALLHANRKQISSPNDEDLNSTKVKVRQIVIMKAFYSLKRRLVNDMSVFAVDVGPSAGICVTVSVPSNKVHVVIVFTKNVV